MEQIYDKCNLAQMHLGERSVILRNLAHILRIGEISTMLRIYCALEKEVQSCANLAHILCIGEISTILRIYCALEKEVQSCALGNKLILCKSCVYIAHWRKKYNLAQILCIDKRKRYLVQILQIQVILI